MEEYKKKTNTGDDVFIRIQRSCPPPPASTIDDSQDHALHPPTAVLLGWFAAKHKNLSKYSALYERMGYNIVQLVAPPSVIFPVKPQNTAVFVLSLMRIIAADERLNKGGLVFMMFSNGGAICAPHLSMMFAGEYRDLIKADDEPVVKTVKDAMAAVVFDSAPCYMHVHSAVKAISDGLMIPHGVLRWLLHLMFATLRMLQTIFVVNYPFFFWNGVRNADFLCPEQYLYSAKDPLVDVDRLDALIEERKRKGRDIRVFRVDEADHVKLLMVHSENYKRTIQAVNEWGINAYRERRGLTPWLLDHEPLS